MVRLDTILMLAGPFLSPQIASAQFYSVERSQEPLVYAQAQTRQDVMGQVNKKIVIVEDTIEIVKTQPIKPSESKSTFGKNGELKAFRVNPYKPTTDLPGLTIPNLIAEIRKNNIKHPKIVLAQAILETGWFKSSVCGNKHNLFGLTNPRTGQYYEFNHLSESVAAYYNNKVQYHYKGGNYLIWLRDIGYAEDRGYIREIIRVLRDLDNRFDYQIITSK